ncbi:DUF4192 domain-containing protein [Miniimonas arenae]|uniref:DUF4192 domain-containing protein n=1 Tax=Miniimonas arenae TaxID=676201 RepID=A0A5C5BD71_9MICO|nr:DUF4192 domain-containing protein [Miniimonas arenae]
MRVAGPAELLSYVPHAMGYHPRSSVALVSLRPPRGRVGLVARMDLADLAGPGGPVLAAELAAHLAADGAAAAFCVLYRDGDPTHVPERDPLHVVVAALETAAGMPPLRDVWVVGTTGYAAWGCTDRACCPAGGRPLADLSATSIAAELVLKGSAPVASRADLAPGRESDPCARLSFEDGVRAVRGRRTRAGTATRAAAALRVVRTADPGPTELGRLSALLLDRATRDAVLGVLAEQSIGAFDGRGRSAAGAPARGAPRAEQGAGPAVAAAADDAAPHAAERDRRMLERARIALNSLYEAGGPAPGSLARAARRALTEAARLASGDVRAETLAVLAWLAWWHGDGATADVCAEEAERVRPGHVLAGLVRDALAAGLPPGWARRGSQGRQGAAAVG